MTPVAAEKTLACGWKRSDHDGSGFCEDCETCKQGLCPGDGHDPSLVNVDGDWHHRACFVWAESEKFVAHLGEMILTAERLRAIGEPIATSLLDRENICMALYWLQEWCSRTPPVTHSPVEWRRVVSQRLGMR